MGQPVGECAPVEERAAVMVNLPRGVLALINRILALPAGLHTLVVVKTSGGAEGLLGWSVTEAQQKLETPRR